MTQVQQTQIFFEPLAELLSASCLKFLVLTVLFPLLLIFTTEIAPIVSFLPPRRFLHESPLKQYYDYNNICERSAAALSLAITTIYYSTSPETEEGRIQQHFAVVL
jgi:hypothetical protein